MICEIITASALILAPVQDRPVYNSVDFFDQKIQVTESVLDRTVCAKIERTQAPNAIDMSLAKSESQKQALRDKARYNARRNAIAATSHCQASRRVSLRDKSECVLIRSK